MNDELDANTAGEFERACANIRTYLELWHPKEERRNLAQQQHALTRQHLQPEAQQVRLLQKTQDHQGQSKDRMTLFGQGPVHEDTFVERSY